MRYIRLGATPTMSKDIKLDFGVSRAFRKAAFVVLSIADAFLTLTLLQHGGFELNPFMAALLGHSDNVFAAVKMTLTAGGVVIVTSDEGAFDEELKTEPPKE